MSVGKIQRSASGAAEDRADDPRFTAYALGAMSGAERAAFEAEIAGDTAAEEEIASIAAAADLLRGELTAAPASLGEAQRRAIEAALEKRASAPTAEGPPREVVVPLDAARQRKLGRWRAVWVAVPAVAAAAAGLFFVQTQGRDMAPAATEMGARPASVSQDADRAAQDQPLAAPQAMASAAGPRSVAPAAPGAAMGGADGKAKKAETRSPRRMSADAAAGDAPLAGCSPNDPLCTPQAVTAPAEPVAENPFVLTARDTKSTFSIDVDTASYAIVRRTIENGQLPHPSLVRVEEMINYFPYADPAPEDEAFRVTTDVASAPWARGHRLLRIGITGRDVPMNQRPPSNLVFLLDVSGSMTGPDRLGLVKQGLALLVRQLDARDRVSIVVYAGASGLVLPPTRGDDARTILDALDRLEAGGSTNGGAGIELAYAQAAASFVPGGTNRVILATDGDFNVGVAGKEGLVALAEQKAKSGVFLSVLGFGQGNLRDATLEQVADKGNGNYAYIDSLAEAKKVLVEQASGTLLTVAKDVKIQVTFDPRAVSSFRLVGYENRVLAHRDFADDTKDAGEIGAGHHVTALYELVPAPGNAADGHLGDVALRFKLPDGAQSRLVEHPVRDGGARFETSSPDLRFGAAVAGFGMVLRGSRHLGEGFGLGDAARIAETALGEDAGGHRRGFVTLVRKAEALRR